LAKEIDMKINIYKKLIAVASLASMLVSAQSCTDLDSEIYSQAEASKFPSNETELLSTVGATYGTLRNFIWAPFEINETTTDELVVPTRGPDWYDNGSWQQLARHTWTPVSPGQINGAWEWAYSVIANTNLNLIALKESPLEVQGKETIVAELKVIRAFAYFWLMDWFGGVPIITEDTPAGSPEQNTRQEVFNFVEQELKEALPDLRDEASTAVYGRMTAGAANALLAKLYLNAEVYTGTPRWEDALAATNAIINSGKYSLIPDFLDLFAVNNASNESFKENIFVLPMDKNFACCQPWPWRTLHYAQGNVYGLPGNPWNGFATRAEFYNMFAEGDERKLQWLAGPQRNKAGEIITFQDAVDGVVKELNFTPKISSLERALGNEGVRNVKYQVQENNNTIWSDNDLVIFRYADVLLMKAEALLRLGNTAEALLLVNQVRERAGAAPRTTLTLGDMLGERGLELSWEGWRRNDLIRFGQWDDQWEFKTNSEPFRALFPIPAQQLSNNPNLVQNPGY
jgi:hypothetical protein